MFDCDGQLPYVRHQSTIDTFDSSPSSSSIQTGRFQSVNMSRSRRSCAWNSSSTRRRSHERPAVERIAASTVSDRQRHPNGTQRSRHSPAMCVDDRQDEHTRRTRTMRTEESTTTTGNDRSAQSSVNTRVTATRRSYASRMLFVEFDRGKIVRRSFLVDCFRRVQMVETTEHVVAQVTSKCNGVDLRAHSAIST
jgi:hypothetical protein